MEGFKRGEVFLRTSFDLILIGVVVNCPALETWKTTNTLKVAYLLSWWEDRRGFWHQIIWCADGGTWQIGVACADMESVNHFWVLVLMLGLLGTGFHAFFVVSWVLPRTIGELLVNLFGDIGGKSGVVFPLSYRGMKLLTADYKIVLRSLHALDRGWSFDLDIFFYELINSLGYTQVKKLLAFVYFVFCPFSSFLFFFFSLFSSHFLWAVHINCLCPLVALPSMLFYYIYFPINGNYVDILQFLEVNLNTLASSLIQALGY